MSLGALGLQAFISKFSADVIGIYSQDDNGAPLQQIVTDANVMKASINTQSRVFRHPLADGSTIIDHRILLPIEIEMALVITNKRRFFGNAVSFDDPSPSVLRNNYNTILEYYNSGRLVGVQTRATYYPNLLIQALPHQETTEVYNGIVLIIKFQEAQFTLRSVGIFSSINPSETTTLDRGDQQPEVPTPNQQSAAAGILDSISGSLTRFLSSD